LYYSTGLGDSLVTVPDLSNLSISAAEEVLKQARLRLVTTDDAPPGTVIQAQTPKPATTVRQGTEIKVTLNGRVTVDR
ncbi:MAG: PASTA domain-containing protein, partial [Bacteroidetes bacterium]|nr:PASTA domain-containing protein [Bacteroidota bacterium]